MDTVIRAVAESDHDAVHQILTSPHVLAGTMRVPFAPLHQTKERLSPRLGIYQRLGFEFEGTMPRFGFGNGAWMDAIIMGRLRED